MGSTAFQLAASEGGAVSFRRGSCYTDGPIAWLCFSGDFLFLALLKGLLGNVFYFSRVLKQIQDSVRQSKMFEACSRLLLQTF